MKHSPEPSRPQNGPASVSLWMWGAVAALLAFTLYISWEAVELNRQIAATNEKAQAEIAKHHELEEKLALAQRQAAQAPPASQQWRELNKHPNFFREMSLLKTLGQDPKERPAVLRRLHKMWLTYNVLRRPEIAYLMCQFGDGSGLATISKALFAGEYDTGRQLEPDGSAAGANATADALRTLVLYGTPQDRQRLRGVLNLTDDPLRKRDELCEILLNLSSTKWGSGLPASYSKDKFPLELAIACLDFTEEVGTIVDAPGGTVESEHDSQRGSITVHGAIASYTIRGCDNAAQAIQNITSRDFGHKFSGTLAERDKAIAAIRAWWAESHKSPN